MNQSSDFSSGGLLLPYIGYPEGFSQCSCCTLSFQLSLFSCDTEHSYLILLSLLLVVDWCCLLPGTIMRVWGFFIVLVLSLKHAFCAWRHWGTFLAFLAIMSGWPQIEFSVSLPMLADLCLILVLGFRIQDSVLSYSLPQVEDLFLLLAAVGLYLCHGGDFVCWPTSIRLSLLICRGQKSGEMNWASYFFPSNWRSSPAGLHHKEMCSLFCSISEFA